MHRALFNNYINFVRQDIFFINVIKNSAWLFSGNVINMLIGLIQGIIIARSLGVEQYGILGIIISSTTVVGQVFDSRSWETSIKYVTQFRISGNENLAVAVIKLGYLVDIITAFLSFALCFILSEWIAKIFIHNVEYAISIRIYSVILLLGWNGGVQALARVLNRFDLLVKIQVGLNLFHFISVLFILYYFQLGLNGILLAYLITAFLSLIIGLYILRYFLKTYFKADWHESRLINLKDYGHEIAKFLISTNITAIMKIIQSNGAILALGYFSTPIQVGYYKIAQSFANKMGLIQDPIFKSIYPELSTLWANKQIIQIKALIGKISLMLAAIGIIATFGVSIIGDHFLFLTVGKEYLPAASVFTVLVFVYTVSGSLLWMGPMLLASGKANYQSIAVTTGSFMMLISLLLLTPTQGALGAALSFLIFDFGWGTIGGITIWQILQKYQENIKPC